MRASSSCSRLPPPPDDAMLSLLADFCDDDDERTAWNRRHCSSLMLGGLMGPIRSGSAFSSSRDSQFVYVAKMVHVCINLEWIWKVRSSVSRYSSDGGNDLPSLKKERKRGGKY